MNRETIYSAVFALVSSVPGLVLKSRTLKHWSDVSYVDQPCLFQTQTKENAIQNIKMPTRWTLHIDLYLYAHTRGDTTISPSSILNPLVDAINVLFTPHPAAGEQTLDGLVEKCRIEGTIETDEGLLGEQGVVIIPIVVYLGST